MYEFIDISFDIFCTKNLLKDMITHNDLEKEKNNKIEKDFNDNILIKLNPYLNKFQVSLTIDHFIKLISNAEIKELEKILCNDITNNFYINICDNDGDSLLHFAVFANNYKIVELLLFYGANPNKQDYEGQTPIYRIIFGNNIQIIDLLIKNNANINNVDKSGNTPLHLAVSVKNYLVIESFLKHGANINIKNINNQLPIDYATIDNIIDEQISNLFNKIY